MTVPEEPDDWRGIAPPSGDEDAPAVGLVPARRARALLGSLLAPRLRPALAALVLMITENAAQLVGPLLIAAAIDRGVPAAVAGRPGPLAALAVGYGAAGLAAAVLRAAFVRLSGRLGQDLLLDVRGRVYGHVQRLSVGFHESYTSGRVISRMTSDLDALADPLDEGLDGLFSALLSVLTIAGVLVWLDPTLAAVVLAGFVPLLVFTRWYQRRSRPWYRRARSAVALVVVALVETLNGIRAVQAFRRAPRNTELMARCNDAFRQADRTTLRLVGVFTGGVRLVGNISLAVVLAWGGARVIGGSLELGTLAAFLLYLRRFYDPLDQLAMVTTYYQSASTALEKIASVLDEAPALAEPARPVPLGAVRGELRLDGVRFGYGAGVVLPGLDLRVPAGQTVALVGATGAGKSTLAKLVARLVDPDAGVVRLDGVDLRAVADAELRRAVTMVTQEAFLFSGTVADNIALGRPDASAGELRTAATAVGAEGLLDEGGSRKRGSRLSAGQRQLVSFARALLADPAVLILDEATSSLDLPSERAVQAVLATLLAGRTALIVAHRLSTVAYADRVLVLDGGRVVQDGPPAELAVVGGPYADLHRAWAATLAG